MTDKILVLGCGPAGLFAALAAERSGYEPVILSKKRRSEMYGAQYLHAEIPGFTRPLDVFQVSYQLIGTVEGYKTKVYGPGYRGSVSPEEMPGDHMGYDIRATYNRLFSHYADSIVDVNFDSPADCYHAVLGMAAKENPAHIISSVPAPLLCGDPTHSFTSQNIWAIGDAPERGVFSPVTAEEGTVVCSGDPENSWYRKSNILGYNSVEWPTGKRPPISGVSEVQKPIATNCNCLPVAHRVGRYGKWTKGVLSHEAYYETIAGLGATKEE